jgi:hypothetical protein
LYRCKIRSLALKKAPDCVENKLLRITIGSKKKDGKSGWRILYDDLVDNFETYVSLKIIRAEKSGST